MRLIPATFARTQGCCYLPAQLGSCAAFAATDGDGKHRIFLTAVATKGKGPVLIGAGILRSMHTHNRRPAPCPILACVRTFCLERVGYFAGYADGVWYE